MVHEDPIVIIGAKRTPLGVFQGALQKFTAPQLAASAVQGALSEASVRHMVDEVYMGCVLTASLGQAPARQVVFLSDLSTSVSGTLVNKVCGSGMKAVMLACQNLSTSHSRVVIAGGMESMSNAPYLLDRARAGYRLGHQKALDHIFLDGLEDSTQKGRLMGFFADETAKHYGFSREAQDNFAISSGKKALQAVENGIFHKEICALTGSENILNDETPSRIKFDKIPLLKPAFQPDGSVTAANASSLADGAAALVLTHRSTAEKNNFTPLAIIRGFTTYSAQPEWFTTAPIGAIKKLIEQIHWSLNDVDLFEINEAFAVVTMAAIQELKIPAERVNVHGGACALGHPIGASGSRILVTLLNALRLHHMKKGIASLCIGSGEAVAMAVELCF